MVPPAVVPPAPVPAAAPVAVQHGLVADPLLHLLRRATCGLTPELVAEARGLGAARWLDQQLAPERLDDAACDAVVARFPRAFHSPERIAADGDDWEAAQDLVRVTVARMCWSRRQLLEVVVDFWSNHLNVTTPSDGVHRLRPTEDRDVIRPHALGRFSDLLVASATSPAMLTYLDGASSTKKAPNENYGRELLELHTVGLDAGYTEADVKASALLLTGLTVDRAGAFTYRADRHHVGPLQVLGFRTANATAEGGLDVAKQYLRYLATHPATARRIATKLCLRFVSDTPPPALVSRLATVYLSSDTAVVPVLRALFASPEFASSTGAKKRRPLEDLVATVRALGIGPGATAEGVVQLTWMAAERGHVPFGWGPPDGYPDVAGPWSGTSVVVAQWNDRLNLAAGWWPRALTVCDARALLPATLPATAGALVDALSERLLQQRLVPEQRDAVLSFLGRTAAQAPDRQQVGWQLPYLVATILDTPAWSAR